MTSATTTIKQAPKLKTDSDRTLRAESVLERRIVWNLMDQLTTAGFKIVAVWDGEELTKCKGDPMVAMEAIFNLDEVSLRIKKQGGTEHGILLVLGNGEDVISDWNYTDGDPDGFNAFMDAFDVEACF